MRIVDFLIHFNLLTFYVNFKLFKFKDACRLPIVLYGKVSIRSLSGKIKISTEKKFGMIKIGRNNVEIVSRNIPTVLNLRGEITFLGEATIRAGSVLSVDKGAELIIGKDFRCNVRTTLIASGEKKIVIGDNCMLSWDVLLINNDFHGIFDLQSHHQINPPDDIFIEDKVWIGARATVLKGSRIPANTVIANGTVVSKRLESANAIYGGTPAKLLRTEIYW